MRFALSSPYGPSPRAWGIRSDPHILDQFLRSIPTCVGNTSSSTHVQPTRTVHPHVRGEYATDPAEQQRDAGPSPRAWGIRCLPHRVFPPPRSIPTCVGNTAQAAWSSRLPAVHPHVRGEYLVEHGYDGFIGGPSPRAWGIRHQLALHERELRSIPTCVGNTPLRPPCSIPNPVHPHVRGEYCCRRSSSASAYGPSPRAWGILEARGLPRDGRRSIPTCVGNTSVARSSASSGSVHPHVRGEYCCRRSSSASAYGPSPRAWGIHPHGGRRGARLRSIPTCVGNTPPAPDAPPPHPVHPHVRGEYNLLSLNVSASGGPSPRAWGIRMILPRTRPPPRSIPTCVGNTRTMLDKLIEEAVHPHVRGEYSVATFAIPSLNGPSPRAWGILASNQVLLIRLRSIPTCVGNTRRNSTPPPTPPVHPHVRGEYFVRLPIHRTALGPSPRAWGILCYAAARAGHYRSIPTCVGNTPICTHRLSAAYGPSPRAWGIRLLP